MNKIEMIASRETNYIYHMLSAARCGYDNDYGAKYRGDYPMEDLAALKRHERLITCSGGEHWGALYTLLICYPSSVWKGNAKSFYQEIIRQADAGDVPEQYLSLAPAAREIAEIMARHYDHYISTVWPEDQKLIEDHISQVMPLFESSDFSARAEAAVGCTLPVKAFHPTMVASVQGGAEAIDISDDQDVFGITRSPRSAFLFIGHEFIIYLLKQALRNEDAFRHFKTWEQTEGLAEYYLNALTGSILFENAKKWVDLYSSLGPNERLSAAERYRKGMEAT